MNTPLSSCLTGRFQAPQHKRAILRDADRHFLCDSVYVLSDGYPVAREESGTGVAEPQLWMITDGCMRGKIFHALETRGARAFDQKLRLSLFPVLISLKIKPNDSMSSSRPATTLCYYAVSILSWFFLVSARADTPIIIQDSVVSAPDAGIVTCVQLISRSGAKKSFPADAKIGDTVRLGIKNLDKWLKQLSDAGIISSKKTGEALIFEQLPAIHLFIGDHLMKTLQPTAFFQDNAEWYPTPSSGPDYNEFQRQEAANRCWLQFRLGRDSTSKESREDWSGVLRTAGFAPRMPVAVGIYQSGTNVGHVLASLVKPGDADPQREFHLVRIAWDGWVITGVVTLGVALVLFLFLAARTGIVRDPTLPLREDGLPPFSLGRCQMAFWFFLVISAFYFLWLITGHGDTDTINGTVLTLIGISAGTALGSAIISNSQADPVAAAVPPPINYPQAIREAKAALTAANQTNDQDEIIVKTKKLSKLKKQFKQWRKEGRFLTDILSEDSSGRRIITFHRFQIVLWTIVLGIVFISEVISKLTMPAFDSTLLTLLGISAGTYLGFKLPQPTKT